MLAELCVESADRFRPVASPWLHDVSGSEMSVPAGLQTFAQGVSSGRWRPRTLIDKQGST